MTETERLKIHQKIRLSMDLLAFAFVVKKHQLSLRYPEMSEDELKKQTWKLIEKGAR